MSDERRQVLAAYLFFAFEQAFHVDRQSASGPQIRFHSLDMREHLALVVTRSPAIKVIAAECWFKRRAMPLVQWFGRLDVIMPVDQDGRPARIALPIGVNHRMAPSLNDPDVLEADFAQVFGEPT